MWRPIEIPKGYKRRIKSLLRKTKYILDHNMPVSVADDLKAINVNVYTLKSIGKEKIDDAALFHHARKEERVLVTYDKDFLNYQLFPLALSPGIIIIDSTALTSKQIVSHLRAFTSLRDVFEKSKVVLQEDTMDLHYLSDNGTAVMDRYRFAKNRPVEIWSEDE